MTGDHSLIILPKQMNNSEPENNVWQKLRDFFLVSKKQCSKICLVSQPCFHPPKIYDAWNILTSVALTSRIRYRNVVESRGLLDEHCQIGGQHPPSWLQLLLQGVPHSHSVSPAVEETACTGGVCHRSAAYLPPHQLHCVAVLLRLTLHWGFQHYLYSQHVPAAIRDTKFVHLSHASILDNTCFRLWVSLLGVPFIFMHDT